MRVLVACEFSGTVREAFAAKGHDAWSCDLLPTERPGQHIEGDVLEVMRQGWDLMIAHPPCTYLAVSGARWWAGRQKEQADAIEFALTLLYAPIERIALENPIGKLSTVIGRPTQIIQPFWFGHREAKATCLWLKNLPPLKPTDALPLPASGRWDNQTPSGQNKLGPSPNRWRERSRTYSGVAAAMAEQWG
jgi:hypothetical protein